MRMAICALGFVSILGQISTAAVQWPVETGGNGHWYELVELPDMTWQEAQDAALASGGYLATITSAAENAFIAQQLLQDTNSYSAGYAFIGAYQLPTDSEPNSFRWVTGEPFNYNNWVSCSGTNQPDNAGGSQCSGEEDYVAIFSAGGDNGGCGSSSLYQWNDVCPEQWNGLYRYIIEYPAPEPTTHDIVITDFETGNIVSVNLQNMQTQLIHSLGPDAGPEGIAMRKPGELFVSVSNSSDTKNVLKLTYNGTGWTSESFTGQIFGTTGPGLLDFDALGRLIVAGNSARAVYVYDPDTGQQISEIEDSGCCNVYGLETDGTMAYAGEFFQGRIWKANLLTETTETIVSDPDRLEHVCGLELGPAGGLYVASSLTDSIVRYSTSNGSWTDTWNAPDVFDLYYDPSSQQMVSTSTHGISCFSLAGQLLSLTSPLNLPRPTAITEWKGLELDGVCCTNDQCVLVSEEVCNQVYGIYLENTTCESSPCPVPCPGDVTGDGQVNVEDLLTVIANWNNCP